MNRFTKFKFALHVIALFFLLSCIGQALPNARWRVDHALETGFDMVAPNEPMIARMAEIILKAEANVEALRDHERTAGPAAPAVRK